MHRCTRSETHDHANEFLIAAKGAPEAVIDLCHLQHERAAAVRAKVTA